MTSSNYTLNGGIVQRYWTERVASGIAQASLGGNEDATVPEAGEAFFYLVGYDDGWTVSDGTEHLTMYPVRYTGGCP